MAWNFHSLTNLNKKNIETVGKLSISAKEIYGVFVQTGDGMT